MDDQESINATEAILVDLQPKFRILNIVSLTLAIINTLLIVVTRCMGYKAAQRMSFKLYMWITISDILTHLPYLFDYGQDYRIFQGVFLESLWANLLLVLFTSVLAYNLHMVFIKNRYDQVKSEKQYVIAVLFISVILMIPSTVLTIYLSARHDHQDTPFSYFQLPINILLFWLCFGLWIVILSLYCLAIFFTVVYKLAIHPKVRSSGNKFTDQKLRVVVARLSLYPLLPVISVFPGIIDYSLIQFTNGTYGSIFINMFTSSIQGTLNFFFFLFDPALPELIKEIFQSSNESIYDGEPTYHRRPSQPNTINNNWEREFDFSWVEAQSQTQRLPTIVEDVTSKHMLV